MACQANTRIRQFTILHPAISAGNQAKDLDKGTSEML